jgi:hypothetical protein
MRLLIALAVCAVCALIFAAAPAAAQNTQSWIASSGSDANACTRAAPCATIEAAIGRTNAGGRIDCVDRVAEVSDLIGISKSLTIDCEPGLMITGTSSSVTLMMINATDTDVVHLRGIHFRGAVNAARSPGLSVSRLGKLYLDQNSFDRTTTGVLTLAPADLQIFVTDTVFTDASSTNLGAIRIVQRQGNVTATLTRVSIEGGVGQGVKIDRGAFAGAVSVKIRDSVIRGNGSDAITVAAGTTPGPVRIVVQNSSVASNGGTGLSAAGVNAEIVASGTRIIGNATGASGTSILSAGGNVLAGNGTDGAFTGTIGEQ